MTAQHGSDIALTPRSVVRALALVAALLVGMSTVMLFATHAAGHHINDVRLAQLFYVDGERNLPTAFSTFLLLTAALLLAVITALERRQGASGVPHWALLSLGFVLMAVDEAWSFHEKLNAPVRAMLGNKDLGAYYYAWVLPAIGLVLLLALLFARFLWRLPRSTRRAFVVAAAIFLGGAVGIELVEGVFDEVHGDRNLVSGLIATVQETLEMTGVIVFIGALLSYLAEHHRNARIRFEPTGGAPPASP